jgi:hypothetical protein
MEEIGLLRKDRKRNTKEKGKRDEWKAKQRKKDKKEKREKRNKHSERKVKKER